MAVSRKDYRKQMADMFIDNLKKISADDWVRPWKASNVANPFNGTSRRYYNGSNQFFLMLVSYVKDYRDPRWYTFNQIKEKGYKLHKDSKGVPVEYWFPVLYDEKGNKIKQVSWAEFNALPKDQKDLCKISFRTSYVFNGSCLDGLPELDINANEDIELSDLVDRISKEMHVPISEDGGNSAFYSPSTDSIHLPEKSTFADEISFNSTALHELSHATGHHSRLNRLTGAMFGSKDYAFEELIAEISSTFMAPYIGMEINDDLHNRNHIAYVSSWIQAIENDPEVLFKAIAKAEVAANYLELKAGIIDEREFVKSLKNAHIAIGEDEKITLIENMFPDETVNLVTTEEEAAKYVQKLIDNVNEMASYFDELQLSEAIARVNLDNELLEFKAYRTQVYETSTEGLAIYHNEKLIYSNTLDAKPEYVDLSSAVESCAKIIVSRQGKVSYSFEDSSDDIKDSQIRAIEENQRNSEALLSDAGAADTDRDQSILKDEDKIIENHAAEIEDIEKFIEDHEKSLAQRNIDQGKTPLIINVFAESETAIKLAGAKLAQDLTSKGYKTAIIESYIEDPYEDSEARRFEALKYHVERTDRGLQDNDFIINEAPLLLNGIYRENQSPEYAAALHKLNGQYRNFNLYYGEKGNEERIRSYIESNGMFLGAFDDESFDKLVNGVLSTSKRLNRNKDTGKERTYDSYKQKSRDDLELLKDSIDIKEYARNILGFNVIKSSKGLYSLAEHDSVAIYPENNFTRFSNHAGGSIIDFIKEFDEKADHDTSKAIVIAKEHYNRYHPEQLHVYSSAHEKSREEMMFDDKQKYLDYLRTGSEYGKLNPSLPLPSQSNRTAEEYLNSTRGISMETIHEWENRDLLYQDEKDNVVFVGRDFDDRVKYFHQRGTGKERWLRDSPSESSTKTNGVVYENRNPRFLYVTEAAIDAMSLQDILGGPSKTADSSFLSLQSAGNTAALARYLSTRDIEKLEAIYLCQDADSAGIDSVKECRQIIQKYQQAQKISERIAVARLEPKNGFNDFNDELLGSRRAQEQQSQTRSPTVDYSNVPAMSV